jgi:hypothetical protein
MALGTHTGGTAPKGWRICLPDGSDGSNPSLADFGLVEHASPEYPPRTRQNVADADGTVWFGFTESNGAKLTLGTAKRLGKPKLINPSPQALRQWVEVEQIKVLNVAGNRSSDHNPEIFITTFETLVIAFMNAERFISSDRG